MRWEDVIDVIGSGLQLEPLLSHLGAAGVDAQLEAVEGVGRNLTDARVPSQRQAHQILALHEGQRRHDPQSVLAQVQLD